MEKRTLIHLACFALALSVILGSSTIYYAYQYLQYESYTEAQHQNSLSQLLNSLNQLETSLEKAKYLPEGALRQTSGWSVSWHQKPYLPCRLATADWNKPKPTLHRWVIMLTILCATVPMAVLHQRNGQRFVGCLIMQLPCFNK